MSKVQHVLNALPKPERELVEAHLAGGTSARWIAETLAKYGHPIGKSSINEWRKSRG